MINCCEAVKYDFGVVNVDHFTPFFFCKCQINNLKCTLWVPETGVTKLPIFGLQSLFYQYPGLEIWPDSRQNLRPIMCIIFFKQAYRSEFSCKILKSDETQSRKKKKEKKKKRKKKWIKFQYTMNSSKVWTTLVSNKRIEGINYNVMKN